jgi:hypothetical protein
MSYTDSETAAVVAAAPLTYDSAVALADKLGKSHRSVIAKAKSLGLEYTAKPKAAPKGKGVTKADLVAAISAKVGTDLSGLEGAKASALEALLGSL